MNLPTPILINLFKTNILNARVVRTCGVVNGSCPVCSDKSKRLYLLANKKPAVVYCHNAGCDVSNGIRADIFFKKYFPTAYSLLGDIFIDCIQDNLYNKEVKNSETIEDKKFSSNEFSEIVEFLQSCSKLTDDFSPEIAKVRKYLLEERNVDESIVNKLYYCEHPYIDNHRKYKGYIIIPFYNDFGIPNYFQGRLFKQSYDNQVRFLMSDFECCPKYSIYNESNINESETVYVVEGIIDSMNVKNSITICGVGISDDIIKYIESKYNNVIWILDNDSAGESLSTSLLYKNCTCMIWPKNINKIKDINELCVKMNLKYIPNSWIDKNAFTGVKGLYMLAQRNFK